MKTNSAALALGFKWLIQKIAANPGIILLGIICALVIAVLFWILSWIGEIWDWIPEQARKKIRAGSELMLVLAFLGAVLIAIAKSNLLR